MYSFSQLQVFLQCPLKYRYQYVDKIPRKEFVESADTLLGKIVHESLEKLYKDINVFNTPTKEALLQYYQNLRTTKEAETLAHQGEVTIHGDFTIDDYKNRGAIYLSKYYDKHQPFADIKIIDTELDFVFDLTDDIKFKMIVDRLDKMGDTFVISDYKTNKKLPTEDKDRYIEQLTMYGIGIKQKYGKYFQHLKAKLYFLHFDIEDERDLTKERMDAIADKYINLIQEIDAAKWSYALGNKKIFPAKQSPLCNYCDYQTMCPLFNYINTDEEVVSSLSLKTITALVDDFANIKTQLSELEKQEEGLKNIFLEYIKTKDSENDKGEYLIKWTEQDVKISSTPKFTVMDKETFIAKIKQLGLFDKYADIARQKVNDLFGKSKEASLEDFKDVVVEDLSYKVTKVKKAKKK